MADRDRGGGAYVCPTHGSWKAVTMRIFETLGVIGLIGLLILAFLVLNNWKGANQLLFTFGTVGNQTIRTLQGK